MTFENKYKRKKDGKPKKLIVCYSCGKRTSWLMGRNTKFISGTGVYYECKNCGSDETGIV